jgi:hypothetical protein
VIVAELLMNESGVSHASGNVELLVALHRTRTQRRRGPERGAARDHVKAPWRETLNCRKAQTGINRRTHEA